MKYARASILVLGLAIICANAVPQSLLQRASNVADSRPNPYAGEESARAAGKKLFNRECSGCHGLAGRGRGRPHTPPLATPLVRDADPGTLFWILRNGSSSHRMPSFSGLPEQQRWQIITYLQSLD